MPHRLLQPAFTNLVEGLVLTFLATFNGTVALLEMISEGDWTRINGPHGVAFIAVCAVIVLWLRSVTKEKNEDKRRTREEMSREARNAELLAALKESNESNKSLTVESIVAQGKSAQAIGRMERTIQHQTNELCERLERIERAEKQTIVHTKQ